jgi:hypothetical protein
MWLASINMPVRTIACEKNKLDRGHAASPDGNLPKLVTQFLYGKLFRDEIPLQFHCVTVHFSSLNIMSQQMQIYIIKH